ncbi:hypothetical protein ACIBSV_01395 [Embleya sp. NPDC050154]|uniref:hypothetical protein n=1 Tax=Embleya sp. NPDC050154 TaxID=3363988 RepID=UPI0037AC9B51
MTSRSPGVRLPNAGRPARLVAFGTWLPSAAPSKAQAHVQWYESGAAWLRPGMVFSAVVVPARLVHVALRVRKPEECVKPLARLLAGPVFYSPPGAEHESSYTALLPVAEGRTWREPQTRLCSGQGLLWVPAPGRYLPATDGCPWWVVAGHGDSLCAAVDLAALVLRSRTEPLRWSG